MKIHYIYYFVFIFIILLISYKNVSSVIAEPIVYDKALAVEKIVGGLNYPVSMSFLGPKDIIVIEKDIGSVKRIVNGQAIDEPLLKLNVDHRMERGLTGVAVAPNFGESTYVFLYFSEKNSTLVDGKATNITQNSLYRYNFVEGKLVNPKLLFKVPTQEAKIHNSGKMVIGRDHNLYLMIGDLFTSKPMLSSNFPNGSIDGSGGIIRLTFDGLPVKGILGDTFPLSLYYAYGIRNGFGLDFDPLTGNLWDTENGPSHSDEINLVRPGFNSGWKKVQGIWETRDLELGEGRGQIFVNQSHLVSFDGKGKYSPPKYIWDRTIAVTPIEFLNSTALGKNYVNDLFVGDYKNGNIYHFDLKDNRTKLIDRHAITNKDLGSEDILIYSEKGSPGCLREFVCSIINNTNTSANLSRVLEVSTRLTSGDESKIDGKVFDVIPKQQYNITASIKLNSNVAQSNITVQGYKNDTDSWKLLTNCIDNVQGPLKWTMFDCIVSIPEGISKIRPLINAGYSNEEGNEAISYFANIGIVDETNFVDLFPYINYTDYVKFGKGFGHITDMQMAPDGSLYILALLDVNDPNRSILDKEINEGAIYRITKIISQE